MLLPVHGLQVPKAGAQTRQKPLAAQMFSRQGECVHLQPVHCTHHMQECNIVAAVAAADNELQCLLCCHRHRLKLSDHSVHDPLTSSCVRMQGLHLLPLQQGQTGSTGALQAEEMMCISDHSKGVH